MILENRSLNSLSAEEASKIWIPYVVFQGLNIIHGVHKDPNQVFKKNRDTDQVLKKNGIRIRPWNTQDPYPTFKNGIRILPWKPGSGSDLEKTGIRIRPWKNRDPDPTLINRDTDSIFKKPESVSALEKPESRSDLAKTGIWIRP